MENLTLDWDLTQLFKDEAEVLKEFEEISKLYENLSNFDGKLITKDEVLEFYNFRKTLLEKEIVFESYLFFRNSLNGKDSFAREMMEKLSYLSEKYITIRSKLSKQVKNHKNSVLKQWAKDADFKDYSIIFNDMPIEKKHDLPLNVEIALNKYPSDNGFSEAFDFLSDVELDFGEIEVDKTKQKVTHASYSKFIRHKDQKVRLAAFKAMNGAYKKFNYTIGTLYLNNIKTYAYYSEIYKYKSLLEKKCMAEKSNEKVLKTLISSTHKNLQVFYDYQKLKQKYLKLKDFYYIDNYVDVAKIETKFDYNKATDLVVNALSVLGEDYIKHIKEALTSGWVDVYEKPAKTSGGFNLGVYGKHPYVLLNFADNYTDVGTLAHELGHAMHSHYAETNQPITKSDTPIFIAEVASIVNERLLHSYMSSIAKTKAEKLFLVHEFIFNFYATVFRQTMFAEFEHFAITTVESKKPLLVEDLNKKYEELQALYFGKDAKSVEEAKFEWSRIPHFYRPYYVYKYATGFIAASIIADKILNEGEPYVKKYLEFLSSGSSEAPLVQLSKLGVDLTKESTIDYGFKLLEKYVKEFEKLTKE